TDLHIRRPWCVAQQCRRQTGLWIVVRARLRHFENIAQPQAKSAGVRLSLAARVGGRLPAGLGPGRVVGLEAPPRPVDACPGPGHSLAHPPPDPVRLLKPYDHLVGRTVTAPCPAALDPLELLPN